MSICWWKERKSSNKALTKCAPVYFSIYSMIESRAQRKNQSYEFHVICETRTSAQFMHINVPKHEIENITQLYNKHWKREPRAPLIGVSAFFLLSLLLLSFSSLKHLPITYVAMMTASVHNSTQCAHNNEIERRKHRVKRNNTTATTKWQRPCKSPSRWPLYTYARKIYFGPDELRSALSGKISSDFVNFALRTNQSECVSDLWGRAPRCATYI